MPATAPRGAAMIRIAVAATAPGEPGADRSPPFQIFGAQTFGAQTFGADLWCRPIRDLRAGRHRSRGPRPITSSRSSGRAA
jgi:hypothetical protein